MPNHILIVEDSKTMQKVMELTFEGENVELLAASNSEEAVALCQDIKPSVAFIDAGIENQSGYQVAEKIRSASPTTALIMLTSEKHPSDESLAQMAGIFEHIKKPFDTKEVLLKTKQALDEAQQAPVEVASSPTPQTEQTPPPLPHNPPPSTPSETSAVTPPPLPSPEKPPISLEPKAHASSEPQTIEPKPATIEEKVTTGLLDKLQSLDLTKEQIESVLSLSKDIVEQVVWEVVPDLAETLIKEEIRRLTAS